MTHDQIDTGIAAFEAIPSMSSQMDEWERESTTAVERSLGRSRDEARGLWKIWLEQNLVELISDYTGPGFETNSRWSWRRQEGAMLNAS
jgi:hypothetical protein